MNEQTGKTNQNRMLERVRALLAKAESTTFAEEAAALTAKAHELIATYAIDLALIDEREGRGDIVVVRIFIDAPYPKEKFMLLGAAARANRCRAILGLDKTSLDELLEARQFDALEAKGEFATIVGYQSDIDSVELLFTSLLVQAVNVMLNEGSVVAVSGRNRTKSFRRSFLVGFAHTIGDRLEATQARATTEADRAMSGQVLPVLASRSAAVDDHVNDVFPRLGTLRPSVSNGQGVRAGQAAGRSADIGTTGIKRQRRALR